MSIKFAQGHAVIIGVGEDLPNTVDDAEGLAGILVDPERCAYPSSQVLVRTGPKATRAGILSALVKIAKVTTAKSTVILYFSGHGYQLPTSTALSYFLMPFGYDTDKLSETAISGAEFTARVQAIRAQKLIVLLDCCYAGGIDPTKAPELQLTKGVPAEALHLLSAGSGRVVIASSRNDELSFAGKPYSAFTLALIESLCGTDVATKDGYVRVSDVALYTGKKVANRTKNRQHPVLNFKKADNFVLACYAGGDTQPKALPFPGAIEIEDEPGGWRGMAVHGQETNYYGNVGTVHTGEVHGFFQPGWNVKGNVYQSGRDLEVAPDRDSHADGSTALAGSAAPDGPKPKKRAVTKRRRRKKEK